MPTSLTSVSGDSLERRLVWTVPVAGLLGLGALWLAALCLGTDRPLPMPEKPVDAQLIEMPPSGAVHAPSPAAAPKSAALPVQRPVLAPPAQSTPQATPAAAPAKAAAPAAASAPSASVNARGNTSGARAIVSPLPKIPDDLRDEALNMTVAVRFHIAVDGSASVELIQPTPNPRLNRLVLETLQQWRFFPAVEDNHPVASIQEVHIKIQ